MRWSDLDSGFRRNDDMPKLALMPPNPLPSRRGSCLDHLNFEHLNLFRISCFEFRI
jgi:hypothetical protein